VKQKEVIENEKILKWRRKKIIENENILKGRKREK
jgi:hypothetical protein